MKNTNIHKGLISRKSTRFKKGFTLVELIIVITILAILATIAFLALQGYTKESRDAKRQTELAQIAKGLEIYSAKKGFYPDPSERKLFVYTGSTENVLVIQGEIGDFTKQYIQLSGEALNEKGVKYTYSTNVQKNKYSLAAYLEQDQSKLSFVPQTYATNIHSYTNVNFLERYSYMLGDFVVLFGTGETYFKTPIEKLYGDLSQSTQSGYVNIENLKEISGENDGKINALFPDDKTPNTYTGSIFEETIKDKTGSKGGKVGGNTGTFTIPLKSVGLGVNISIGNNCSISPIRYISSNPTVATISGTIITTLSVGTTTITPEGGGCEDNKGKILTVIKQWRDEPGTSCSHDDYIFTYEGKEYRWAGCNSVLGTGVEWGVGGTISSCYNYKGEDIVGSCPAATSTNAMYSTAKEKNWNPASSIQDAVDNIWGKLYTYAQASATTSGACPSGWHLPTNEEWTFLEAYLNGGELCRPLRVWTWTNPGDKVEWACEGLGWKSNNGKPNNTNMAKELKIPLSGYRFANSTLFKDRGKYAFLWTTDATMRIFVRGDNRIARNISNISYAGSVRCVKD